MKRVLLIIKTLLVIIKCDNLPYGIPYEAPILTMYPCFDSRDVLVWYDPGLPPKERNQYYLYFSKAYPTNVSIEVKFNADVNAIMNFRTENNTSTSYSLRNGSRVTHKYRTSNPLLVHYGYKIKGTVPGRVPYLTSLKINNIEFCNQPNVGFLDAYVSNTLDADTPLNCGRRKVEHVELIVNGAQTKPGDWPWHTAIYKWQYSTIKYICGGSLISSHFVLTAAHCASVRGVPVLAEILSVVLGKYNLIGGDIGSEEREVVGWGFDNTDTLSRTMKQTQMPMVEHSVCMSSNPNFYTSILNNQKFCAGYRNHTSACNGDSGSAFQVFVPDSAQQNVDTRRPGTWLVRGIVSLTVSREDAPICDPDQYVVYTDVAEYCELDIAGVQKCPRLTTFFDKITLRNIIIRELQKLIDLMIETVSYTPCIGDYDININYEPGLPPDEENKYQLSISKEFPLHTNIVITFDTDASITLNDKSFARISLNPDNSFTIRFFKSNDGIRLTVKGLTLGIVPYITSLTINSQEYCTQPYLGYLDTYIQGYLDTAESPDRKPQGNCGRRQVTHTELIVNGAMTKPGDWPWHVALYKIDVSTIKYICGGTLISKNYVLTAAHCITLRGVPVLPESLSAVLGKFNLIGGDTDSQEREIVGWGFENTDALAPQLRKAKMPIISESTCIKSNPVFYSKLLTNNKKFCAGYRNGTSACNGDSGSAFQVFLPDTARDDNPDAVGSWSNAQQGLAKKNRSRLCQRANL
ncbi:jg20043 [Pararge aegeria aegeria]|uniref:Jg20043 protein n=1 Tax=Pararge aegeria aegeria TaxID=348720 RepID=A0A8S4R7B7_9NEOP|nr:jg20043 [Pararge aegeria aegeria]